MSSQYVCSTCGQKGHNKRFHSTRKTTVTKTKTKKLATQTKKTKKVREDHRNTSVENVQKNKVTEAYEKFVQPQTVEEEELPSSNDVIVNLQEDVFANEHETITDRELNEIYSSAKAEYSYDENYREREDERRKLAYARRKVTYVTDKYLDGELTRTEHINKVKKIAAGFNLSLSEIYDEGLG